MNYIIHSDKSKLDLAKYYHACCFSPCLSTLTTAIQKGNFLSWPGIQSLNFKKILKTTSATEKGHLEQEKANLQSTKLDKYNDHFPTKQTKKRMHVQITRH